MYWHSKLEHGKVKHQGFVSGFPQLATKFYLSCKCQDLNSHVPVLDHGPFNREMLLDEQCWFFYTRAEPACKPPGTMSAPFGLISE